MSEIDLFHPEELAAAPRVAPRDRPVACATHARNAPLDEFLSFVGRAMQIFQWQWVESPQTGTRVYSDGRVERKKR
jgi:hypothetical protein